MATAASDVVLRIVLLGNSWSQRNAAGNLLFGAEVFQMDKEPNFERVRGRLRENVRLTLINTPDLLLPKNSDTKLKKLYEIYAKPSDPGPLVFLLVLQSEDFTEQQKRRLCRILQHFGNQAFDQSLVLVSTSCAKRAGIGEHCMKNPALMDIITQCGNRCLELEHLELRQLMTSLDQFLRENYSEQLGLEHFRDQTTTGPDFQIMLFGKSAFEKTTLGNFIIGKQEFNALKGSENETAFGEWRGRKVTVVKTLETFNLQVEALIQEMRVCAEVCPPGPNVLLLLVEPSDFTEENRQTLKFILSLFGRDALKSSMVISTHEEEQTDVPFRLLLGDCGGRHYSMAENIHLLLMEKIDNIVQDNKGTFLTFFEEPIRPESEPNRPALNIVLCGSRRAEKTSAARAILGRTDLRPGSGTSECVKHRAEVCGRQVSLVELPALCGRPLETVMKVSLSSVSLCDPEGVHAFILVLPVGPLTDEDKKEFETIVNTFGSQVKAFTMTLFTVEVDPSAPQVVNYLKKDKDIQEFIQSCGGHFFLNIRDRQQIPELLDSLEKHRAEIEHELSYTTETFAHVQIEKISVQQAELKDLRTRGMTRYDEETLGPESIRIVLLGKTGCGKSSSGNTILGRKEFQAKSGQTSVTRKCQKAHGEVNGRPVTVVDTPGLFDTNLPTKEVHEEVMRCISMLAPGPHVFLLVLSMGRLTPEERETLQLIKKAFGKDAEKFTIVLFTGGGNLKYEGRSIKDFIENECTDSFKKIITDCGGRYHLFDNHDDKNQTQVSDLIAKIDAMVKENGGSCYTNKMLQEAEAAIEKETEKILHKKEEEMRRGMEALQSQHEEEIKAMKIKMDEQRAETEKQRKLREHLLQGMKENLNKEREEREKDHKRREEEERRKKELEERHRQWLRENLDDLERRIQVELEDKQTIDRELLETREELQRQRDSFEKHLKDWWEIRFQENEQIRYEEQTKLKKLEEEYKKEKENDEKKRKEEDKLRQQKEDRGRKAMEENYKRKMEDLKKTYEEEARKKAEEFNDFKDQYKKDYEALQKKHEEEMNTNILQALSDHKKELKKKHQGELYETIKCVTRKRGHRQKVYNLLKKQEKEMKGVESEEEKNALQEKHIDEITAQLQELMGEVDSVRCLIL